MNSITQIKQWGNSKALRLPTDFARLMNLNVGEDIELKKIDEKTIQLVVITKQAQRKRLTLAERIQRTKVSQLPILKDWDEMRPVGNEI